MADKAAIERALLEKARELFRIAAPLLPREGGSLISITAYRQISFTPCQQKTYDHVSAAVSIIPEGAPENEYDDGMQIVLSCWADPSQAEMEIYRSE